MSKKIIKLVRNTGVVWIFDEDVIYKYGEPTLIYGIAHIKRLNNDVYELKEGNVTKGLQFGVKEIGEKW